MDKPKYKGNSYTTDVIHADYCHPKDEYYRFIFHLRPDAPKELKRCFSEKIDKISELNWPSISAYSCALELKDSIATYLYNGDDKEIAELVAYLESVELQDEIDLQYYIIEQAKYDIEQAQNKIKIAEGRLANYSKPEVK